jgi:capsular polysaccharide biosynthesis protein
LKSKIKSLIGIKVKSKNPEDEESNSIWDDLAAAASEVQTEDLGPSREVFVRDHAMISDGPGNPKPGVAMAKARALCLSGAITVVFALAQLHCGGSEAARRTA